MTTRCTAIALFQFGDRYFLVRTGRDAGAVARFVYEEPGVRHVATLPTANVATARRMAALRGRRISDVTDARELNDAVANA